MAQECTPDVTSRAMLVSVKRPGMARSDSCMQPSHNYYILATYDNVFNGYVLTIALVYTSFSDALLVYSGTPLKGHS